MQGSSVRLVLGAVATAVWLSLASALSLFLALLILWTFGPTAFPVGYVVELVARFYVFCLALGVAAYIGLGSSPVDLSAPDHQRLRVFLMVFAVGVAFALLDPFHPLSGEESVIRYWTAAMLGVAALTCLAGALDGRYRLWRRSTGAFLSLVFAAAAADELLEFHERLGRAAPEAPQSDALDAQDLATLAVALAAIFVAGVVLVALIRAVRRGAHISPSDRRAVYLFCSACTVFLAAMLLDTFDVAIETAMLSGLDAVISPAAGPEAIAFLREGGFIPRAANSVEEVLEYSAAALLLLMSATFLPSRRILRSPSSAP